MRIHYMLADQPRIASWRYRCAIPAAQLKRLGHDVTAGWKQQVTPPCAVIFQKHYNRHERPYVLDYAKKRSRDTRIIFDICDDYFADGVRGEYYRSMCAMANVITVSSAALAKKIEAESGKKAFFIGDPYEMEECQPVFSPQGKPKLLWYGNPKSARALGEILSRLRGYPLHALTLAAPKHWHLLAPLGLRGLCSLRLWSLPAMRRHLKACDLVIIPSRADEVSQAKSANRMIEAIRCGKFVIASPMPAYLPFAQWMYLGDIAEGIEWAMEHRREIPDRIRAAQDYVRREFSPEKIGAQWEAAIGAALSGMF